MLTPTSPINFSANVSSNLVNSILCVIFTLRYATVSGPTSVSPPTFNGVATTYVIDSVSGGSATAKNRTYVWYILNPPSGSHSLSIPFSGVIASYDLNAIGFQGVNQTSPINNSIAGSGQTIGSGTPLTGSLTTTVNNAAVIGAIGVTTSVGTVTQPTGYTSIYNDGNGTENMAGCYKYPITPAGAQSLSWSSSSGSGVGASGIIFGLTPTPASEALELACAGAGSL